MHLKSIILLAILSTTTYYSYSQAITGLEVHQDHNVLFGESLSGAGIKMMWVPEKAAFRAGNLSVFNYNNALPPDQTYGASYWDIDSIGLNSAAFGVNNRAIAQQSTAWGAANRSSGDFSTTWGFNNDASQGFSTAWGSDNSASSAYSTVWGLRNTASGSYSTAWGNVNTATQAFSTAWGSGNTASNIFSTAWGFNNSASGSNSTVWGCCNTAAGTYSTAWGAFNQASGESTTVWGLFNNALSIYETVLGRYADTLIHSNPSVWEDDDHLFVVGNGSSDSDRNNALTILKSGETYIDSTLSVADPILPEHAATKNYVDSESAVEGVQPLAYSNGWENYGAGFQGIRFYKHQKRVYIEGLARKVNGPILEGNIIGTLPVGYRPDSSLIFKGHQNVGTPRIDIQPNGDIIVRAGLETESTSDYISLSGISFRVD